MWSANEFACALSQFRSFVTRIDLYDKLELTINQSVRDEITSDTTVVTQHGAV